MRIYNRYLSFEKNKILINLLKDLAITFKEDERSYGGGSAYYSIEFFVYEDELDYESKTNKLNQFGLEPQIGTEFSKVDLETAEWFTLSTGQFGYPQPEANYMEATYERGSYCPHCQIGKKQITPFRLRTEPKQKHSMFLGLNWVFDEVFVRDSVITDFNQESIKGIHYTHPVFNKNRQPVEAIQQMHVDTFLPDGLITDNLQVETCQNPLENKFIYPDIPFCGQKKYNYPSRGMITFNKEVFFNQPDFVRTAEWFGSGGSASRPIIVSRKVRDIIIKHKWRGAFFTPISLI